MLVPLTDRLHPLSTEWVFLMLEDKVNFEDVNVNNEILWVILEVSEICPPPPKKNCKICNFFFNKKYVHVLRLRWLLFFFCNISNRNTRIKSQRKHFLKKNVFLFISTIKHDVEWGLVLNWLDHEDSVRRTYRNDVSFRTLQ